MGTQKGYEQMLGSWGAVNINQLIAVWGPPSRTYKMPDGDTIYTYNRSQTYTTPIRQSPTYTAPSTTMVNVIGNTAYATTYPGQTIGGEVYGGETIHQFCTTHFFVNEFGRIRSWRYEGNACLAPEKPVK